MSLARCAETAAAAVELGSWREPPAARGAEEVGTTGVRGTAPEPKPKAGPGLAAAVLRLEDEGVAGGFDGGAAGRLNGSGLLANVPDRALEDEDEVGGPVGVREEDQTGRLNSELLAVAGSRLSVTRSTSPSESVPKLTSNAVGRRGAMLY